MVHRPYYRQESGLDQVRAETSPYNAGMTQRVICELCGTVVVPHAHFIVRIDVFADPSMPEMSTETLEELNIEQTFDELLKQMEGMTIEELQDGVHRRFEYKLCPSCHRAFLSNPLGKPRVRRTGEN